MDTIKKILICDDIVSEVELFEAMLSTDYSLIKTLTSGKDVVKYLKQVVNQPNLLILDIAMPKMDGFEVAREIRNLDKSKNIPILLVTAWGKEAVLINIENNADLNIIGYIQKPVTLEILLTQVKTILN